MDAHPARVHRPRHLLARAEVLRARTGRAPQRLDHGFTLVEILIAIVLVGILAAVAVLGISRLSDRASQASCRASADAATAAAGGYFAGNGAYPSLITDLTESVAGVPALLDLPAGASASGRSVVADQWTMTMSTSRPPTFACATSSAAASSSSSSSSSSTSSQAVPGECPSSTVGWRAQYYSAVDLSGSSTLCRDDGEVDFDWGSGAAAAGLPADRFSVRWTRTQDFAAGDYTFTVGSDDGTRLYVDGTLVHDRWTDQQYTLPLPIVRRSLTAGKHTIVLEYFENAGLARASLTWFVGAPPSCSAPTTGWLGEYYDNVTLTGTQAFCRDDNVVKFDWGMGSPAPTLPVDGTSVRWTRTQDFAAGSYTFAIGSDDGSRLYIDGVLVFDRWINQGYPSVPPTVTRTLSAGSHKIVMEYFDYQFAAKATLSWYVGTAPVPPTCTVAASGWLGEYFNNRTLQGTPAVCRDDAQPLNVNWYGTPAVGVSADSFSVRWTRSQDFTAGTYTFALGTDDGGRLYIDGVLVIDRWVDQGYPAVPPTTVRTLSAGPHTLVVEFYDAGGGARATLTWS